MRDPARIDRVVEKLRALWHTNPDMRLGQLLVNLTRESTYTFHTEDDVLEQNIDRATTEGWAACWAWVASEHEHCPCCGTRDEHAEWCDPR